MNVLVTGGTGFLGQRLALRLQALGDRVTVLGRNAAIGNRQEQAGLRFVQADLRDEAAVAAACQGQDGVFHSGALSSPWGDYQTFYNTNVLGTRHVVQGCLKHGVSRLVHVSTSAVYFTFADQLQIPESMPFPKPVGAYARSKQLAEAEVQRGQRQGLSTLTIRPRGIFGPGDTTILPRLLAASDRTGIPLIRQGQAVLDMTYIDNVVEALCRCCEVPDALSGRVYNISNGEPTALSDLLMRLSQQLEQSLKFKPMPFAVAFGLAAGMEATAKLFSRGEPMLTRYTVGLLTFSQTLSIEAAVNELGYRPQISLDEGIARFAEGWERAKGKRGKGKRRKGKEGKG
ncbi:MAG: NAD(P)-dependent oxidoreductase [Cyanobacteria bacterium J06554_6]